MPIINQVVSGGGGSAPTYYIEKSVDANGKLINTGTSVIDMTGVKSVGKFVLFRAYQDCAITNAGFIATDLISLTEEGCMYGTFANCTGLTSFSAPNLTTINAKDALHETCQGCTNLTNIDLRNLVSVDGMSNMTAFAYNCPNLVSCNLDSLEQIKGSSSPLGQVFRLCTSLITMRFPSLKDMNSSTCLAGLFRSDTALESVWFYALTPTSFGSLTNQFNNMLQYCTNVTVHFPMAIQSTIGSWTDVTGGFGGTCTTVLFDLVTTLTGADSNTYTRSEKNSTATATAWVYNDTLYYTSGVSDNTNGVNEPAVSDTIYSDAACTQSVTTITAIA